MADAIQTELVAEAFIKQYYAILNQCPDNVHKFYQEESVLSWPSSDGAVTPVTTFSGIQEKIMSSDCKGCSAEVKTVDSQDSVDGGIIVAVTGSLNRADDSTKSFSQTFFLAKNETGFFVLNDILRFFNHAASVESAASVENGKVEEVDIPVSKDTVGKDAPKSEKAPSVAAPASTTTTPKISYASVVAKEARPVSPKKAVTVASNANNKQQVDGGLKVASTPSGDVPKAPAPSNKPNPKSPPPPPRGNYVPNTGAYPEGRGIYIGRLPYDITKEGVVEVVKQFGPVRRNAETVQIRRHEDGFCCGFVEFESADSARRAVEAHHIKFGDKEAYITYKRSSSARGNNNNNNAGRARSPTRATGGLSNGGQNGGDQNKGGQVRDPRQRKSPVGGRRWQSRDRSD